MSIYATNQELIDRYGDLDTVTHLTGSTIGTPDQTVLTKVIAHAEGTIDSYLAQRYAVPVDEVDDDAVLAAILREKTLDLAEFHLSRRGDSVPDSTLLAYDTAISWLKDIASGLAFLPSSTGATQAETTSNLPGSTWSDGGDRIFTRSTQSRL